MQVTEDGPNKLRLGCWNPCGFAAVAVFLVATAVFWRMDVESRLDCYQPSLQGTSDAFARVDSFLDVNTPEEIDPHGLVLRPRFQGRCYMASLSMANRYRVLSGQKTKELLVDELAECRTRTVKTTRKKKKGGTTTTIRYHVELLDKSGSAFEFHVFDDVVEARRHDALVNQFLQRVNQAKVSAWINAERGVGGTVQVEPLSLVVDQTWSEELFALSSLMLMILCALYMPVHESVLMDAEQDLLQRTTFNMFGLTCHFEVRPLHVFERAKVTTKTSTRNGKRSTTYALTIETNDGSPAVALQFGSSVSGHAPIDNAKRAINHFLAHAQSVHQRIGEHLDAVLDDDDLDKDGTCCVCLSRKSRVAFLPCKHVCVCTTCSPNLEDCPLCRAHIQQRHTLFL